MDLFNPTDTHLELRKAVRKFAEQRLAPQAMEHDRNEAFNIELFRTLGTELGIKKK